jgi:voltage-gated potassium channel
VAGFVNWLRARKHLILLASLVALAFVQPIAQHNLAGKIAFDVALTVVTVTVFLAVFDRIATWIVAFLIAAPAVVLRWLGFSGAELRTFTAATEHGASALFLAFAVTILLRDIFRAKRVGIDGIAGVVCGYLLGALAWGNLYFLVETVAPGSFSVQPSVAWQLQSEPAKRYMFDYYSFVTITAYGDNNVTAIAPAATSLTWMETVFGQFYMAIVVSQLVSLKLSQAMSGGDSADWEAPQIVPRRRPPDL